MLTGFLQLDTANDSSLDLDKVPFQSHVASKDVVFGIRRWQGYLHPRLVYGWKTQRPAPDTSEAATNDTLRNTKDEV